MSMADQLLKDRSGNVIGRIRESGTRLMIHDQNGNVQGWYTGGKTFDKSGNVVGHGNLLAQLL